MSERSAITPLTRIFWRLDLRACHLPQLDLSGLDFSGADFSDANLFKCVALVAFLTDVNFSEAFLKGCKFYKCHLEGTNFQKAELTNAEFYDCFAQCASFSAAKLIGSNFFNTNLEFASLHRASVWRTNILGSKLSGCRLDSVYFGDESRFDNTELEEAWGDEHTHLPNSVSRPDKPQWMSGGDFLRRKSSTK